MSALVVLENSCRPVIEACSPAPAPPLFHLLEGDPPLVFMVNGSRLFEVDSDFFAELKRGNHDRRLELLEIAQAWPHPMEDPPLNAPTAITLNIAHS